MAAAGAPRAPEDVEYLRRKGVGRVVDEMVRAMLAEKERPTKPLEYMLAYLRKVDAGMQGAAAAPAAAGEGVKTPRRRSARRGPASPEQPTRDVVILPDDDSTSAAAAPAVRPPSRTRPPALRERLDTNSPPAVAKRGDPDAQPPSPVLADLAPNVHRPRQAKALTREAVSPAQEHQHPPPTLASPEVQTRPQAYPDPDGAVAQEQQPSSDVVAPVPPAVPPPQKAPTPLRRQHRVCTGVSAPDADADGPAPTSPRKALAYNDSFDSVEALRAEEAAQEAAEPPPGAAATATAAVVEDEPPQLQPPLAPEAEAEVSVPAAQAPANNRLGGVAPPDTLWIISGGYPELDGAYDNLGMYNGMPYWGRLGYRLYSTQGGRWMLTDQEDKMCDNKGAISSTLLHGGVALPPEVGTWDEYVDGNWYHTDLTVSTSKRFATQKRAGSQPSSIPDVVATQATAHHDTSSLLPQPVRAKAIHRFFDDRRGVAAAYSAMQGWSATRDHAATLHPSLIFTLADGHNGGATARRLATELATVLHPLQYQPPHEPATPSHIAQRLAEWDAAAVTSSTAHCGASLAALLVVPDASSTARRRSRDGREAPRFAVQTIHAGACRIVMWSAARQEVMFATKEHVGRGGEVTRCFGDRDAKVRGAATGEAEVQVHSCGAGDVAVLCNAGVYEYMSNEEVLAVALYELRRCGDDTAAAAARICETAYRKGSPGNLTCTVVLLSAPNNTELDMNVPLIECVPGPYIAGWHPGFRRGYETAALDGGLTLAEAIAKRYNTVLQQVSKLRGDERDADALALREEFSRFHPNGHDVKKLERMREDERLEWFATWAIRVAQQGVQI